MLLVMILSALLAAASASSVTNVPIPDQNCTGLKNLAPVVPGTADIPTFTARTGEKGTCVVECDSHVNGTVPNYGCFAFTDGVTSQFEKDGLVDKDKCQSSTISAPDVPKGTIDNEMFIQSCPTWLTWIGWDRGMARTMGNMRQQLLIKDVVSLESFIKAMQDGGDLRESIMQRMNERPSREIGGILKPISIMDAPPL